MTPPRNCSLRELLWPQFTINFDDHIRRNVQPSRRLANRLGIGRFVQAVGLLLVGTEKRKQPLYANIHIDLRDRSYTIAS